MWVNKPTTKYYQNNHQKKKKKTKKTTDVTRQTTEKCLGVSEGKFGG